MIQSQTNNTGYYNCHSQYRAGIIAVFTSPNHPNQILVGSRNPDKAVNPGNQNVKPTWQLPQGGIDQQDLFGLPMNEAEQLTLFREMEEELGLTSGDYKIVSTSIQTTKYDWKDNTTWLITAHAARYKGQQHRWFLCSLNCNIEPLEIDLTRVKDPEFDRLKWKTVDAVIDEIAEYKREAHKNGFQMLGLYQ